MNILANYKNGNSNIVLYDDGTKIRITDDQKSSRARFAESIDIKITNKCNGGCLYCHEDSKPDGEHGDIMNLPFFDTLHKGQEVAIGGGNVLEHPDLLHLLRKLKMLGVIPNITVNQMHFMNEEYFKLIQHMAQEKLIYGLGISVTSVNEEFLSKLKELNCKNVVLHVINGIVTERQLKQLENKNIKLLILGYKTLRRGEKFIADPNVCEMVKSNQDFLCDYILNNRDKFKVISFDNLAIEQMGLMKKLDPEIIEKHYMGNDGELTFYIDCVKKEYAISSTSQKRYHLLDNVDEMFNKIQDIKNNS